MEVPSVAFVVVVVRLISSVAKPKARRQKLAHNLSVSQSPTISMVDEDRRRGKGVASILRALHIYRRTNNLCSYLYVYYSIYVIKEDRLSLEGIRPDTPCP